MYAILFTACTCNRDIAIITFYGIGNLIGRNVGKGLSKSTKVPSGGTIDDHVIRFAVDTDGDGFVDATVGGVSVRIRASAVAWCCGYDGKIEPYAESNIGRSDDVYSWSGQQVKK